MATGILSNSNRNDDESSQQTNSNSSEHVNCPQCHIEFNNPQVCQHINFLLSHLKIALINFILIIFFFLFFLKNIILMVGI